MVENWIREYFQLDREAVEILLPYREYIVGVKIVDFIKLFGEVIQTALDQETDVVEAVRASDPNNLKGYNEII